MRTRRHAVCVFLPMFLLSCDAPNEPYGEMLQGLRYFVRHGVIPQVFMSVDLEVIKPLAVALVQRGRENGGLPKEVLAPFD